MSSVNREHRWNKAEVLQVGQCGNQVGREFWRLVDAAAPSEASPNGVWRHWDGHYRSVNVDTEPKVIRNFSRHDSHSDFDGKFRPENCIAGRSGRGSNWAMGYHGLGISGSSQGEGVVEPTLEALRREIERCDSFQGVILLHSLSGGTGSGLGSRLSEAVRDAWPMAFLLSCAVAPFGAGESPLQQYNSVLALATLVKAADGVMLMGNDDAMTRLRRRRRGVGRDISDPQISLAEMNRHLASCLAGAFLPVDPPPPQLLGTAPTSPRSHPRSIGSEPWDLVRTLCPVPNLKFMEVDFVSGPRTDDISWNKLTASILAPSSAVSIDPPPHSSPSAGTRPPQPHAPVYISSLGIARGVGGASFHHAAVRLEKQIVARSVAWNPFPVEFWTARGDAVGKDAASDRHGNTSSLTMVANGNGVVARLDRVLSSARAKHEARAFLHWYERYGVGEEDWSEAFNAVETVVEEYRDAVR